MISAAAGSAKHAAVRSGVRQTVDSCGRRRALVVVFDSCRDLRRDVITPALRSESRPPLGTSPLYYKTPRFGSHARAESMGTGSLEPAGLERAFHFRDTCIGDRRVRAVGKIAGKSTRGANLCQPNQRGCAIRYRICERGGATVLRYSPPAHAVPCRSFCSVAKPDGTL